MSKQNTEASRSFFFSSHHRLLVSQPHATYYQILTSHHMHVECSSCRLTGLNQYSWLLNAHHRTHGIVVAPRGRDARDAGGNYLCIAWAKDVVNFEDMAGPM